MFRPEEGINIKPSTQMPIFNQMLSLSREPPLEEDKCE